MEKKTALVTMFGHYRGLWKHGMKGSEYYSLLV
jgi:hypothetical protein